MEAAASNEDDSMEEEEERGERERLVTINFNLMMASTKAIFFIPCTNF